MGNEGHKSVLLRRALETFFRGKGLLASTLVPITEHQGGAVSLRALDFFVTNYSKLSGLTYTHKGRAVSIYRDYRSQLRAYTKRYFDPFCRRERITFSDGKTTMVTTVGQLNFFRWVIETGMLDVCREHAQAIEAAMSHPREKPSRSANKDKQAKPRRPILPAPALTRCSSHRGNISLAF
jgi:hypothetical protein